jgi:hypothetical protein
MTLGPRVQFVFCAALAAAGCGCAAKPYARDPLVRDGLGVRGDRTAAARPLAPPAEPTSPEAPDGPTIGSDLLVGR